MTPHLEVLSADQRRVLDRLAPLVDHHGFYLAGGTGIALRLGHRESHDFDWFRKEVFDPVGLHRELAELLTTEEVTTATGTLHARLDGVRVTFLAYGYPLLEETSSLPSPAIEVASLDDLAAMKLAALLQRGERKDLYDIDAVLLDHRSLEELVATFERKFGFDATASLLRALTYFDDAEGTPDPRLLDERLSWGRTCARLVEAVRRYAAR
jgi:hypothetical protein